MDIIIVDEIGKRMDAEDTLLLPLQVSYQHELSMSNPEGVPVPAYYSKVLTEATLSFAALTGSLS